MNCTDMRRRDAERRQSALPPRSEADAMNELRVKAVRRAAELEGALREAEAFIAGALPHFAQDRRDAVEEVLPRIRAALAGSAGNAGVPEDGK